MRRLVWFGVYPGFAGFAILLGRENLLAANSHPQPGRFPVRSLALSALIAAAAAAVAAPSAPVRRASVPNLPLTFEKNTGRYPKDVRFVARSGQGTLFLTSREAVLALTSGDKSTALRLKLAGSNPGAAVTGLDKQPGITNYFIGNDPKKWHSRVPTYSRVKLAGVYPGIDLVYYGAGKGRTLEYDFVVKPGSDASRIRMAVSGAKSLRSVGGTLVASTACGDVTLNRPYAYQTINGVRKQVACSFTLERGTVAFQIAKYDASRPLVVDPTLEYSTFLGGSGNDRGYGVAVDASGCAYVYGTTQSADMPVIAGSLKTTPDPTPGTRDTFLAKFNADGTALVYCTYFGGSDNDYADSVKVDAVGCAYVVGTTYSTDLPTTPAAFDKECGDQDAYVAKLDDLGASLHYCTYLGGSDIDLTGGMAIDNAGCAYVGGTTISDDFPVTPGAFQTAHPSTNPRGFVTRLDPTGSALVYSTLLGGLGTDEVTAITVDSAGCVYATGYASSSGLATPGAFQSARTGNQTAFVAKFNAAANALVYFTYLGGTYYDAGVAIAVDSAGCAVMTGYCESADFPTTPGAFQSPGAEPGCVVAKLNAGGTALVYSTYVGPRYDRPAGLALGADGSAYLVGTVGSRPFPVTGDAYQSTAPGNSDGFLCVLNPTGSDLTYSTYFGGPNDDGPAAIAVAGGAAYIVGTTDKLPPPEDDKAGKGDIRPRSPGATFPITAGAYQTVNAGARDWFVSKFTFTPPAPTVTVDDLAATEGSRISLRGLLTDAAGAAVAGKRLQFSIDAGAWVNSEILTSATGYATLTLTAPAAGTHAIACRFQAADGIPDGSGSGTLTTTALPATATSVQDRTAGPGDGVSLLAYLQLQSKAGVAGKQLEFQFNGGAWTPASALTDAVGKATLAVTAPATAGEYTINARFLGDAGYAASAGTAKLTVAAKRNVYVYTLNRSGKVGASGTLIATFYWYQKNGTLTPVSGKSLRFQCAGVSLDSTVTTDASGKATVAVTPASAGAHPFTVTFTADTDYNAGSGSGTLTVAP